MPNKISIYQLLPRLFGNDQEYPVLNGNIHENHCGKFAHIDKESLKDIKKLGITHVWYTGVLRHATTTAYPALPAQSSCIVKGKAGSPYAIVDYYDVAPDLAVDVENRMQEFGELLKRTREMGLKSIIDFVPNHLSRDYKSLAKPKSVKDFGEEDDSKQHFNPQNNFYYLPDEKLQLDFCKKQDYEEFPAKVSGNDCFHANPQLTDWYETIKLNYGVDVRHHSSQHFSPIPSTWYRMLKILDFWVHKEVDGFRCDMVEMVPVEFWQWVIPQIKAINPHIIFIGEVYQPHLYQAYIQQGGFDYLYDKSGLYDKLRSLIRGECSAQEISHVWQGLQGLDAHMLRFLENHDEQRIASPFFAGDARKAIPAMLLSATMHQGPVMTYFGQEFGEAAEGESGFSGDDGRTSIFDYWKVPSIQKWRAGEGLSPRALALQKEYKEILNFSINSPIIAHGNFYDLMWANKDNHHLHHNYIYAFMRSYQGKALLIVLNFSDKKCNQKIIIPEHAFQFANKKTNHLKDISFINIFSHKELRQNVRSIVQDGVQLDIPEYHYVILEF